MIKNESKIRERVGARPWGRRIYIQGEAADSAWWGKKKARIPSSQFLQLKQQ
ncbi:MAG: hypothetical protein K2K81_03225 [Muribaculaceae bacterium]|nr:hypothetical protein [Muribaculaceae bacterium]